MIRTIKATTKSIKTTTRTVELQRSDVFDILCASLGFKPEATEFIAQGLTKIKLTEELHSDSSGVEIIELED